MVFVIEDITPQVEEPETTEETTVETTEETTEESTVETNEADKN